MTGVSTVLASMVESVRWWTMWADTPVIVCQDGMEENVQLVSHIEKNIILMDKKCNKSIWFLKWLFFLFADDDECLHRSCLNNATCLNTPGSFVCQCNTGWEGNICERGEVPFFIGLYLQSFFCLCGVWYIVLFFN